jgi:hypothetical protein
MRLVVLLTAVCFIAAAEASATVLRRSLRVRLRHRSPASSTSSGSRRCFVRNWQATARPRVSGSAISSSATLIASNVIVLSADPFGSQSPPLGNLGRAFVFTYGRVAIWSLPLTARLENDIMATIAVDGNGLVVRLLNRNAPTYIFGVVLFRVDGLF